MERDQVVQGLERFIIGLGKKVPKAILRIYTLLVVCLGFVLFRADTLSQAGFMIKEMFTGTAFTAQSVSFAWQQMTPWVIVMFAAAVAFAAPIRPLMNRVRAKLWTPSPFEREAGDIENKPEKKSDRKRAALQGAALVICVLLLFWYIVRLSGGTYNPFIYFRF